MKVPITILPQAIIDYYNLTPLVHNGYIYIEICKEMYGLPQAGILANDQLKEHLAEHDYIESPFTA